MIKQSCLPANQSECEKPKVGRSRNFYEKSTIDDGTSSTWKVLNEMPKPPMMALKLIDLIATPNSKSDGNAFFPRKAHIFLLVANNHEDCQHLIFRSCRRCWRAHSFETRALNTNEGALLHLIESWRKQQQQSGQKYVHSYAHIRPFPMPISRAFQAFMHTHQFQINPNRRAVIRWKWEEIGIFSMLILMLDAFGRFDWLELSMEMRKYPHFFCSGFDETFNVTPEI